MGRKPWDFESFSVVTKAKGTPSQLHGMVRTKGNGPSTARARGPSRRRPRDAPYPSVWYDPPPPTPLGVREVNTHAAMLVGPMLVEASSDRGNDWAGRRRRRRAKEGLFMICAAQHSRSAEHIKQSTGEWV